MKMLEKMRRITVHIVELDAEARPEVAMRGRTGVWAGVR
jgi:hypothetical protein